MSAPSTGPDDSTDLNLVQRWFQSVITHPDGAAVGVESAQAQQLIRVQPGQLEKIITRSRALTAAERIAVYANAYYTRLLECLGEVFPIIKRTLGEDTFNGFAFSYLQEYPSHSYTLNHLGQSFVRYLSETRPDSVGPLPEPASPAADNAATPDLPAEWPDFLVDLANLEWTIYEVFDGPGVEGQTLLSSDKLLDVATESWPSVRITPVVCLKLLATRFPVNDFYTARRKAPEDEPVTIPALVDSFAAVTRREYVVRRYNLSHTEFELLNSIQKGATIGEAIERAATVPADGTDRLANDLKLWFRNWTAEGFFQSLELPHQV